MKCWSDPTAKDAYRLSWASLVITFLAAMAGIGLWKSLDSSLALVFGLENCVDFLSSAVVLWRFFAPYQLDAEVEAKLKRRELKASIAISFILVLLGLQIIVTASDDIAKGKDDEFDKGSAIMISFFSIPIFGSLTAIKFRYSKALDSASLYKDGICSLIGTTLALALFINTIIIENTPEAWWMDPVIAIFAGVIAFLYGLQGLYVARVTDKQHIFSCKWWTTSEGDAPVSSAPAPAPKTTEMVDQEIV